MKHWRSHTIVFKYLRPRFAVRSVCLHSQEMSSSQTTQIRVQGYALSLDSHLRFLQVVSDCPTILCGQNRNQWKIFSYSDFTDLTPIHRTEHWQWQCSKLLEIPSQPLILVRLRRHKSCKLLVSHLTKRSNTRRKFLDHQSRATIWGYWGIISHCAQQRARSKLSSDLTTAHNSTAMAKILIIIQQMSSVMKCEQIQYCTNHSLASIISLWIDTCPAILMSSSILNPPNESPLMTAFTMGSLPILCYSSFPMAMTEKTVWQAVDGLHHMCNLISALCMNLIGQFTILIFINEMFWWLMFEWAHLMSLLRQWCIAGIL